MTAEAPPTPASMRRLLRSRLPSVYGDAPGMDGQTFAMRFVEALEQVLDPVVATLDLLPAQLDLALADPAVSELVGAWLGIELDAALTPEAHRRLVRNATEITRVRGTARGLELVLGLSFEDLELEVRDGGRATWSREQRELPAVGAAVTVVYPHGLHAAARAALRRVVDEVKPAGAMVLFAARGEGRP
jgi:phage tail-like protein